MPPYVASAHRDNDANTPHHRTGVEPQRAELSDLKPTWIVSLKKSTYGAPESGRYGDGRCAACST